MIPGPNEVEKRRRAVGLARTRDDAGGRTTNSGHQSKCSSCASLTAHL